MKKKLLAGFVLASMTVAFAGCSMLGGNLSEKKFSEFVTKELDAEEMDFDDVKDATDEEDFEDIEDGVYFTADGKDATFLFDEMIDEVVGSPSKVEKSANYVRFDMDDEEIVVASLLTFKDEKKIDSFIEDAVDLWDEMSEDAKDWAIADEGETEALAYFDMGYDEEYYCGIYKSGKTALVIVSINDDDTVEDLCKGLKIYDLSSIKDAD